jgi:hypothetical protein
MKGSRSLRRELRQAVRRRSFKRSSAPAQRPTTAALLASLDLIAAERTTMLSALDDAKPSPDRHEAKRRAN